MQLTIATFDIEQKMRQTHADRILKLLRENDFVPTAALRLFSYNHTARIAELRDRGYVIKSEKSPKCGFRLIGKIQR